MMLLQNQIHWMSLFPKRPHFEHYEWCIEFAFDMKWAIDTMAYHTIPLQSFFAESGREEKTFQNVDHKNEFQINLIGLF